MLRLIAGNWWLIVLRGVCAILFGLVAWAWPGVTLAALVLLWGAYAFADGVLALVAAISGSTGAPWWVLILAAIVSIGAAGAAVFFPGVTTVVLLYVIAIWAVITGVLEIAAAIQLRKEIEGELWLGLAGLASVLFGFLLIARPGLGAVAVVWMIGLYAIMFGAILVALGFRVKALKETALPA